MCNLGMELDAIHREFEIAVGILISSHRNGIGRSNHLKPLACRSNSIYMRHPNLAGSLNVVEQLILAIHAQSSSSKLACFGTVNRTAFSILGYQLGSIANAKHRLLV